MAIIAFSFSILIFVGYYKIEDTTRNTASKSEELKTSRK